MPSRTVRFYFNKKRVATAVDCENGRFLQVYPEKIYFTSEERWRSHWEIKARYAIQTKTQESKPKPKEEGVTWTYKAITKKTIPAGNYYVGDLCYALKDEIYEKVFGIEEYRNGYYENSKGGFFMVASTAWGDGCYKGTDKREYCVDAGIIGIASLDICRNEADWDGGHKHTFKKPVDLTFSKGIFDFYAGSKHFVIDTVGNDEEEYHSDS